MKVLLLKDVPKLGYLGDVVDVKPGYARNYLLPYHIATWPTEENIQAIAEEKKRAAEERARRLAEFKRIAEQVNEQSVTIEANANEDGTLYGSVGAREIAEALQAAGHPVLPEHVRLEHPIRELDNRTVELEFAEGVTATVKVWVVRAGALPEDEQATGEDQAGAASDEPAESEA